MASGPITSWKIDGERMETERQTLFSWAPKSVQTLTAAMKLKDTCSLEEKIWQICVLCLIAQLCLTLCDPMNYSPPGSPVHGDSPGKNTRVDCHALLQGIFPTQGLNPGLPHCRQILYCLSHSDFIYFKLNQMIKCIFIFNFLAAPCSTGILVSNQGSNLRPCSGSMAS